MTSFPNFPRLLKGALVGVDICNPLASGKDIGELNRWAPQLSWQD